MQKAGKALEKEQLLSATSAQHNIYMYFQSSPIYNC